MPFVVSQITFPSRYSNPSPLHHWYCTISFASLRIPSSIDCPSFLPAIPICIYVLVSTFTCVSVALLFLKQILRLSLNLFLPLCLIHIHIYHLLVARCALFTFLPFCRLFPSLMLRALFIHSLLIILLDPAIFTGRVYRHIRYILPTSCHSRLCYILLSATAIHSSRRALRSETLSTLSTIIILYSLLSSEVVSPWPSN